jgi:hypothetical protein
MQRLVPPALAIAGLLVATLSIAYSNSAPSAQETTSISLTPFVPGVDHSRATVFCAEVYSPDPDLTYAVGFSNNEHGLGGRITIVWTLFVGASEVNSKSTDIPTGFHPTAVCSLTSRSILVAGKRRNGRTLIQEWTMSAPVTGPLVQGGQTISQEIKRGGDVVSVETLFDEAIPGKDIVKAIWRNPSTLGQSAFVWFRDSDLLYSIGTDGTLSPELLEIGANSPCGALPSQAPEPYTVEVYSRSFYGNSHALGFMYIVRRIGGSPTGDDKLWMLRDDNQDGIIENCSGYASEQVFWEAEDPGGSGRFWHVPLP